MLETLAFELVLEGQLKYIAIFLKFLVNPKLIGQQKIQWLFSFQTVWLESNETSALKVWNSLTYDLNRLKDSNFVKLLLSLCKISMKTSLTIFTCFDVSTYLISWVLTVLNLLFCFFIFLLIWSNFAHSIASLKAIKGNHKKILITSDYQYPKLSLFYSQNRWAFYLTAELQ